MNNPLAIAFCLLFLSLSICSQTTPDFDQFLKDVRQDKATSIQLNGEASPLFLPQERPIYHYFETFQQGEQWFFLSYNEQEKQANQMICQCSKTLMESYFQQRFERFQEGNYSAYFRPDDDTLGEYFFADHCLSAGYSIDERPQAPIIPGLLSGHSAPPSPAGDTIQMQIDAQLISREDGQWVLDLSGNAPDGLTILQADAPQLHQLQTGKTEYYPGNAIASWRADLVRRGHFTYQLAGYERAVWEEDLGNHRVFPVADPEQHWNVQFMLRAAPVEPEEEFEARGSIGLIVNDGSLETLRDTFDFLEVGIRYQFEHDEDGTIYISKVEQEEGSFRTGLAFYATDHWREVLLTTDQGDTVAHYKHTDQPSTIELTPEEGVTYLVANTRLARQSIRIPFQQKLPFRLLQEPYPVESMERYFFQINANYATDEGQRIQANYDFIAPTDSPDNTFVLHQAYDDTGKNLLLAQADSIDAYNAYLEQQGPDLPWWMVPIPEDYKNGFSWEQHVDSGEPHHYHLTIRLWDKPGPNAQAIYLNGEVRYQMPDGSEKVKPWYDTLQLGTPLPVAGTDSPALEFLSPSLSAHSFTIGETVSRNKKGMEAHFEFPVPANHSFFRIDRKNSRLNILHDDTGQDLLAIDQQLAKLIELHRKAKITPPQDSEYSHILSHDWRNSYGGFYSMAEFFVQSRVAPTPGANKVFGQTDITYYCMDEADIEFNVSTIDYEDQEEIQLVLNGHTITFHRFFSTEEIGGQTYQVYNFDSQSRDVIVGAVGVKDGEERISPDREQYEFDGTNLYIPEGLSARQLKVGIAFAELHTHQETVDFEVSIGSAFDNE